MIIRADFRTEVQIIEHEEESIFMTQSDVSPGVTPKLSTGTSEPGGSSVSQMAWLEAALSSTLSHPNIVRTYDCQTYDPLSTARRTTGIAMHGVWVSQ
jgi:hypothetical protein